MSSVDLILGATAAYTLIGIAFAIAFVAFGVSRVDPAAKGAPIGFRLLILPGVAALWPVMAAKWRRGGS